MASVAVDRHKASHFSRHSTFLSSPVRLPKKKKRSLSNQRSSFQSSFQRGQKGPLPLRPRLQPRMSSPSSPSSPKRAFASDGEKGRPSKQQKLDRRDVPAHFKGLKKDEAGGLEKTDTPRGVKRSFVASDPEPPAESYSRRAKYAKLDEANEDETTRALKMSNLSNVALEKKEIVARLSVDPERMPASAQRGMANFTGVLCYRISLLQALLHLPLLVGWLWDWHLPENCVADRPEECFSCVLRLLALTYWRAAEHSGAQLPKVFEAMHKTLKNLGWAEEGQADPDEQLLFFFKALRQELPSSVFTLVEAIFQSYWTQKISCSCGHQSTTPGTESKLTVCLAPRIPKGSLAEYVKRCFSEKVPYRCDGCNLTADRLKVRKFNHTGDVLCIQLSQLDNFGRKINWVVPIPSQLDLTSLRHANNGDSSLLYELTAIVQHSGTNGNGHYVCSAAGPDGQWQLFNDRQVSKCSVANVARGFVPVLLFFRRKK